MDLGEIIHSIKSIKLALYTTNVGKNIHLVRDTSIKHIFIGHGDSDKSSSANNLVKLYDYMFVAGDAHINRIVNKNIAIPKNYFIKIGRPQLKIVKNENINNQFSLLYAPTWEGYYKDSCYSSLPIISNIISEFVKNNTINFNFKPHPLTGTVNYKYKKIKKMMCSLSLENHDDLYRYFQNADILIADISAILSDFLYFDKPIILYHPEFIHNLNKEYPISECCYIINDSTDIGALIDEISENDYLKNKRMEMKKYIMGDEKGQPANRFYNALNKIIHN